MKLPAVVYIQIERQSHNPTFVYFDSLSRHSELPTIIPGGVLLLSTFCIAYESAVLRLQLPMDNSSPTESIISEIEYGLRDHLSHVAHEARYPVSVVSDRPAERTRLSRACDRCRSRKIKVKRFS